ncbi:MAG TPA: hypothetical protein PKD12_03060 [Nitrospira sp.]|nr:hypothetical protein [Nitrospira sp.]
METVMAWFHNYEYPAIVLLLMLGVIGLLIPDKTLLHSVGYLSFTGELSLPLSLLALVQRSITGITISYGLSRFLDTRILVAGGA